MSLNSSQRLEGWLKPEQMSVCMQLSNLPFSLLSELPAILLLYREKWCPRNGTSSSLCGNELIFIFLAPRSFRKDSYCYYGLFLEPEMLWLEHFINKITVALPSHKWCTPVLTSYYIAPGKRVCYNKMVSHRTFTCLGLWL